MIQAALTKCIELAINFIEKWDPEGLAQVRSDGVLCLKLEPISVLYFDFSVLKLVEEPHTVRATIEGNFANLVRYFMENSHKNIHVSGDLVWLQHLVETIKSLDISFSDLLASIFPHPIAGPTAHFLQKIYTLSKQHQHTAEEKLVNLLYYEKEWLATPSDIQGFVTEIDAMLLRIERIEARIANLEGK